MLATSSSPAWEYRLPYEPSLMCNCRIGMSLVTASEPADSWLLPMSGVSLEGVLEWLTELGERDDPDCLDSRPPATVSACSSMLKDGIGGLRLWRESICSLEAWGGGIGGRSRVGAVAVGEAIVRQGVAPFFLQWFVGRGRLSSKCRIADGGFEGWWVGGITRGRVLE